MARLIYLEDVIEKIVNFPSKVAHDAFYGRKQFTPMEMLTVIADRQHEIIDLLNMVKEVDAVEVVRCKDCVHSFWDEENEMWKCVESAEYDSNYGDYIGFVEYHNDDFFCAYGERKGDGDDG